MRTIHPRRLASALVGVVLGSSVASVAVAQPAQPPPPAAQPAPTPTPAPPPAAPPPEPPPVPAPPPVDDEATRRLEQRIADLEGRLAAQERRHVAAAAPAAPPAAPAAPAEPPAPPKKPEPFAFGDFSWMPGNYGAAKRPLATDHFTGEVRVDAAYHHSFANPIDNTIGGSSEVFRHGELQLTQIGVGGDFVYENVHARFMTQFGMYSQTTPRNDPSAERGQWGLDDAYRYISEAYGGYRIDALNGINLQAGIFMSYVGLWSYYNFDNWTYQPSYVSSNTPWFFNGVRAQVHVTDRLKIEPWLVNGWQAYGRFNHAPGVGVQIAWRPTEWLAVTGNQYYGTDTLGNSDRRRVHTDDSIMVRWFQKKGGALSKAAASLTLDAGCETGGGVSCSDQYFLGFMIYNRLWFADDTIGLTIGGGAITNPGRYLVLVPPINGATSFSGTPYFTAAPGDPYKAWDMQITGDYMPTPYTTFRAEFNHRAASVEYFTGHGGVTPPGGNQGSAGSAVPNWTPDLDKSEQRLTFAFSLKL